jgi:hypothetical protein
VSSNKWQDNHERWLWKDMERSSWLLYSETRRRVDARYVPTFRCNLLPLSSEKFSTLNMEAAGSSERWYLFIKLQGLTSQKTVIFITTSNLTTKQFYILRYPPCVWSRDSSAGIATGFWLDGRGSFSGRGTIFSSPQRADRVWAPLSPLSNGYREFFFPGVKRRGRKADHSPPSSSEIKNGGAIAPLPMSS